MEDEVIKDDELEPSNLDGDELVGEDELTKKKSLLDDENVESLDDAVEEELADEAEPFDDVNET